MTDAIFCAGFRLREDMHATPDAPKARKDVCDVSQGHLTLVPMFPVGSEETWDEWVQRYLSW